MTSTLTPYRSPKKAGRDGFAALLRAEWTKFRTVRAWVIGMVAAALVTVLLGVLAAASSQSSCGGAACGHGSPPLGPDGEAVNDGFFFVHQQLPADGVITVRVGSVAGLGSALEPWAKAGIIVKRDTTQGSAYAAVMLTGANGVRMQDNFTHDTAGTGTGSKWLRLTRSGDTLTGYESPDGTAWKAVGTVRLAGLGASVPAGLFVASPPHEDTDQQFGSVSASGDLTRAVATFDQVSGTLSGGWKGEQIGANGGGGAPAPSVGFTQTGGTFTVTGSGDISPARPDGHTLERSLVGGFAGLIVVVVLGVLAVTGEYRRGLIRTTFTASPRRGHVLAAKAVVLGAVTFVAGLVAVTAAVLVVGSLRVSKGETIMPVTTATELRVIVGTAALLAVAAVFSLAVGALLRRSAGAVTAAIGLMVLPYILAIASVLPVGAGQWLLRVTPAAGFAIQQSVPEYTQVAGAYWPSTGYFPLSPLGGFAVLCAWTVLALGLAVVRICRSDA